MAASDEHLEESLKEYNARISELEEKGDKEALLDALTYRSTILMMLESYVSSISDVEDALDLCEHLRTDGKEIDPGILIKLYENRGQLCFDSDPEQMISDYDKITELLDKVGDSAKHYERKEMVTMCVDCAADLIDKGEFDRAMPFAIKSMEVIADGKSKWESNYLVETYNIIAQVYKERKDWEDAKENFGRAIMVCNRLGDDLNDMTELAFAFVNLGDIALEEKNIPEMITCHEEAVKLFTSMNEKGKLDDVKILIDLHNDLATYLMDSGEVEKAEKHLMAAMALGMPEMRDTMNDLGITKK